MKRMMYALLAVVLLGAQACKKDSSDTAVPSNTWRFRPEGFEWGSYETKIATLSTQGYQVFKASSKDNPSGGNNGIASDVTLYFKNVNPPPTGTYKVTDVSQLHGGDEVAIYMQIWGDPRLGLSNSYWFSPPASGQTISYTFANGKASVSFENINMTQSGTGPKNGMLSANISQ